MAVLRWINAVIVFFLRALTILIAYPAGDTLRLKISGDGIGITAIATSKIFWSYSIVFLAFFLVITCMLVFFESDMKKKLVAHAFVIAMSAQFLLAYYYSSLIKHPLFFTIPKIMEPAVVHITHHPVLQKVNALRPGQS